jgi:hypothetical protein
VPGIRCYKNDATSSDNSWPGAGYPREKSRCRAADLVEKPSADHSDEAMLLPQQSYDRPKFSEAGGSAERQTDRSR